MSFNQEVEAQGATSEVVVMGVPDTLSRVFAALADPTRRDMVGRLSVADATVNQLAAPYDMSLQAVYKHLRVLEKAGLVSRPPGPQPRMVRLEADALDVMNTWIERYRRQAEERYRRLDAVLARMTEADAAMAKPETDDRKGQQP